MTKTAKELALKILKNSLIGTMATIEQNKPHSRYMTFFNDDFIITQRQVKRRTKWKKSKRIQIPIFF